MTDLLGLSLFVALVETVGISAIMPFISLATDLAQLIRWDRSTFCVTTR